MSNAYERGWGNPGKPGSSEAAAFRSQHIVKVVAGGVDLYVHKDVSHLFVGFINELVLSGYRLDVNKDDWGYNNRNIRGYEGETDLKYKSNHSWGLAIDLNSGDNPLTASGTPPKTDMPVSLVQKLIVKYGLTWGYNYNGRKDSMHFEFTQTPADVSKYPLRDNAPTTDVNGEEMKGITYRVSVDPNNSKTADGDQAIWVTTDRMTTHVLSYDAYIHGSNLGWYAKDPIFVPSTLHGWLLANTHGGNA